MDVPVAANILGVAGAVCWSIQLIPQIVVNYRRHHTIGLQPTMMILWACAGVPLGVYNIVEEFNIALRIQPQVLTLLSLITWIQCYYYSKNWSILRSIAVVTPVAAVMGGMQVGLIFALRAAKAAHISWPLTLMAVLAAVLLAAGVLRHYYDIWTHRTVRGISFLFVAIDAAGDVFSLASVFFQPRVDVQGVAIYAVELVLWLGVMVAGGYFNMVPWLKNKLDVYQSRKVKGAEIVAVEHVTSQTGGGGVVVEDHQQQQRVTLHDLPSSTSVFQTASQEMPRERRGHGGDTSSV